jgi:hypothetical protein
LKHINQKGELNRYFSQSGFDFEVETLVGLVDIAERGVSTTFVPRQNDLLYLHWRSTGAVWKKAKTADFEFNMCDLAGRTNEREKWIHFANLGDPKRITLSKENPEVAVVQTKGQEFDVVFFVIDSHCFCQNMLEDGETNRMKDSIDLLAKTLTYQGLQDSKFMIVLTKVDKLKSTVESYPDKFQEFFASDGSDAQKQIEAYFQKFVQEHNPKLDAEVISVSVFDEQDRVTRKVKKAVKKIIPQVLGKKAPLTVSK